MRLPHFLLFLLIFCLLFTPGMQAQYMLQGRVTDKKGDAVPFATAVLQSALDSSIIATELVDSSGIFTINTGKIKGTFVNIVAQGYLPGYKSITDTSSKNIHLNFALTEEGKQLNAVTITAKKPLIERKPDRVIFNVESSISSIGSDALSVLKKAPGVRVHDGDISLTGKSTVTVMINDKMLQVSGDELAEMLSSIPAENLSKIEIITAPPAKYDAAGNSGIINIVTKHAISNGFKGIATIGYSRRSLGSPFASGNANYKNRKLNAYINMSTADFRSMPQAGYTVYYPGQKWDQHNTQTNIYPYIRIQAGADYAISKKSTLGFLYTIGASTPVTDDNINTKVLKQDNNILDSVISTKARENSKGVRNVFNLNYEYRIDSSGKKLNIDLDYFTRTGNRSRDFNTTNTFADGTNTGVQSIDRTKGTQLVNIKSVKADITWPTKIANFALGAKASFISNGSDNVFSTYDGHTYIADPLRTNEFDYTENTQSLYASMEKSFHKLGVQAGLRAENTQARGYSPTLAITNDYQYLKLFPSLFLQYTFDDDNAINFNYTRRIDRPDFMLLNPFRSYSTPTSYETGNPFLQPSYSTNLELGYTLKSKYTLSLYLQNVTNLFAQILRVDTATGGFNFTNDNVGSSIRYGFNLGAEVSPFGWWECSAQFYGYYVGFDGTYYNTIGGLSYSRPSFNASVENTFYLDAAKTWSTELNADYQAKQQAEYDLEYATFNMEAGIRKLLMHKRMTIALNVEDIFATDRYRLTNLYNKGYINSYGDERTVRLSLSYKFGTNAEMKRRQNTSGIEERSGIGNGSGKN